MEKLGVVVKDLPHFVWAMRPRGVLGKNDSSWVYFCNRDERLMWERGKRGVLCDWREVTLLWGAQVFPALGEWVMRQALRDWPVEFKDRLMVKPGPIEVSFIIGHRGRTRLGNLLATLKTIAAQRDVSLECLVVEQASDIEVQETLPDWVRYIHTPLPYPDMPYSRSWAFNVGARAARGRLLVFHDNDVCMPREYGKELVTLHTQGYRAMRLQRFAFDLDEATSSVVMSEYRIPPTVGLAGVIQNSVGRTIAVDRETYFQLGGHDEAFVGWGWEDNEFFQRCQTTRFYPHMYLPTVHLYHDALAQCIDQNAELFGVRSAIPAAERVAELAARQFGNLEQLNPPYISPAPSEE
jgi:N-terminal domain of galactosyltransferase